MLIFENSHDVSIDVDEDTGVVVIQFSQGTTSRHTMTFEMISRSHETKYVDVRDDD